MYGLEEEYQTKLSLRYGLSSHENGTLQDQSGRDMPDEPSICEVIEKKSRHGAVGNVEITSRKEHDDKLEMCNYKSGYLLKLSKRRFKDNTWRRRKCVVDGGHMQIFFEKEHKSPRCINLSASSNVRILSDTSDDRCFALASKRKTYHLQAETLMEREEWMSALRNSKHNVRRRGKQILT